METLGAIEGIDLLQIEGLKKALDKVNHKNSNFALTARNELLQMLTLIMEPGDFEYTTGFSPEQFAATYLVQDAHGNRIGIPDSIIDDIEAYLELKYPQPTPEIVSSVAIAESRQDTNERALVVSQTESIAIASSKALAENLPSWKAKIVKACKGNPEKLALAEQIFTAVATMEEPMRLIVETKPEIITRILASDDFAAAYKARAAIFINNMKTLNACKEKAVSKDQSHAFAELIHSRVLGAKQKQQKALRIKINYRALVNANRKVQSDCAEYCILLFLSEILKINFEEVNFGDTEEMIYENYFAALYQESNSRDLTAGLESNMTLILDPPSSFATPDDLESIIHETNLELMKLGERTQEIINVLKSEIYSLFIIFLDSPDNELFARILEICKMLDKEVTKLAISNSVLVRDLKRVIY